VIVKMDLREFFPSTSTRRVRRYFRQVGWNRPAAKLLVRLCTYEGGLPQGAPTSPRLSNLVNYRLDVRLTALAAQRRLRYPRTGPTIETRELGGVYTRYADDLTFSFTVDDPGTIRYIVLMTKHIVRDEGYTLHQRGKLQVRRRHARQQVTGLVVNQRVNLPRVVRRWLRAVEHRLRTGQGATLAATQVAGWRGLQQMIARGQGPSPAE
jgi:RNA-directed DNA polymerase